MHPHTSCQSVLTNAGELRILQQTALASLSFDWSGVRIHASVSSLISGEVAVRVASGHLIPVRPAACPLQQDMDYHGVEPVCEAPGEGLCCTELGGKTARGTVQCAALHAPRAPQQQPMVALVALQKREKLPPPVTH